MLLNLFNSKFISIQNQHFIGYAFGWKRWFLLFLTVGVFFFRQSIKKSTSFQHDLCLYCFCLYTNFKKLNWPWTVLPILYFMLFISLSYVLSLFLHYYGKSLCLSVLLSIELSIHLSSHVYSLTSSKLWNFKSLFFNMNDYLINA